MLAIDQLMDEQFVCHALGLLQREFGHDGLPGSSA